MARDLLTENAWVFDHNPNASEIEPLLKLAPAWHGSDKTMADYIGYVVSIQQNIGSKENRRTVWRLYTTVAGKIAILHDAHRKEDGTILPTEEDVQAPDFKGDIVIIRGSMTSPLYGTVYEIATGVQGEKARGADQTNPVENTMTSWRGRAASALCGAGCLPYTGIASAEEVNTANARSEMAEIGIVAVTKDNSERPAQQSTSAPEATKRAVERFQKQHKFSDTEMEAKLKGFFEFLKEPYDGSAYDHMLTKGVGSLNDFLVYFKENAQ